MVWCGAVYVLHIYIEKMAISCPLCCQSIDFDLLRMNLINIQNHSFICPICGDVQHSLDNLAAHLTQHIDLVVPNQIENNSHEMHCDANNAIQNTIVDAVNCATICSDNIVDQNSNGNLIQNFDVSSSPLPPTTPISPPVSPMQNLNIAAEASSSGGAATVRNDHIVQIVQPFACNLCDGTFRSKDLQQMHMQLVHEINICRSRENNHRSSSSTTTMYPCCWCPKCFKTIGSLRLHVRMVHGASHVPQIGCTLNTINFDTSMSNNNNLAPLSSLSAMENDEKKSTKTGDLAIASTSITPTIDMSLNNLPAVHNNQSDYYRNYGLNDTTFGTNNGSNSSTSSINSINNNSGSGDGNAFEQKDTDKPYNGNNNNSKEMTINSTDDRIHKCDICNKCFTTKYFLKKHKRLHTGKMK